MNKFDFRKFLDYIQGLSTFKKILFVIASVIAVIYLVSCTSTRNITLSVDKADNVNISVTDSLNSVYPSL